MHPLLGRRSHLALYLTLWIGVSLLLAALLMAHGGVSAMLAAAVAVPLTIAYSFVCLSSWYVARSLPLALSGTARVVATAAAAAILSSAIWVGLARLWLAVLARRFRVPDGAALFDTLGGIIFGFGMLLYLLSVAVSYLLTAFEASQEAQRRGLQVQVLAREAELRSLRAQIDPHFLFNSLHSISALTTADAAGARRMCLLLADFLRESLSLGVEERITLARELALIERFLAIERVRFGDRLASEITAGGAGACLVPPLLLQPLVENAVTHGIAHVLSGGTIRIAAERQGPVLRIVTENPCDPDRPARDGGGVGLSNVRARLRGLYGLQATVLAGEQGALWRVELTLPAVEAS